MQSDTVTFFASSQAMTTLMILRESNNVDHRPEIRSMGNGWYGIEISGYGLGQLVCEAYRQHLQITLVPNPQFDPDTTGMCELPPEILIIPMDAQLASVRAGNRANQFPPEPQRG